MKSSIFSNSSAALLPLAALFVLLPVCTVTAYFPPWVNTQRADTQLGDPTVSVAKSPARLPPRDDTFSLIGIARELLAAPDQPEGVERYDGAGRETGGIWRTNALGLLPSTVVAAPLSTAWITKQEASGSLVAEWPESVSQLLGPKSLSNLASQPKTHASIRRVFAEALSPKAVLRLQPIVEDAIAKRVPRWQEYAESGEPIQMLDEINAVTLEAIAYCFLGDYAADLLEDIMNLLPALAEGLVSVPRRMPWPLSKLPVFAFGKSMDSRASFKEVLSGVLLERKAAIAETAGKDSVEARTAGVLDTWLLMQKQQLDRGGAKEGELVLDDEFVTDNVVNALFAGYHTTGALLTRVVQLLGTPDSEALVEQLLLELSNNVEVGDGHLEDATSIPGRKPAKGIFGAFALLEAVVQEAFRLHPPIVGVMRTALRDIEYNGFRIPAGTNVQWNLLGAFRAESVYPEPMRFCPFRFLHGEKSNGRKTDMPLTGYAMSFDREQARPQMFGFGKHMCPGRELAKLEILLFLREFLPRFDFDLVEGQNLKGKLPTNEPKGRLRVILKTKGK